MKEVAGESRGRGKCLQSGAVFTHGHAAVSLPPPPPPPPAPPFSPPSRFSALTPPPALRTAGAALAADGESTEGDAGDSDTDNDLEADLTPQPFMSPLAMPSAMRSSSWLPKGGEKEFGGANASTPAEDEAAAEASCNTIVERLLAYEPDQPSGAGSALMGWLERQIPEPRHLSFLAKETRLELKLMVAMIKHTGQAAKAAQLADALAEFHGDALGTAAAAAPTAVAAPTGPARGGVGRGRATLVSSGPTVEDSTGRYNGLVEVWRIVQGLRAWLREQKSAYSKLEADNEERREGLRLARQASLEAKGGVDDSGGETKGEEDGVGETKGVEESRGGGGDGLGEATGSEAKGESKVEVLTEKAVPRDTSRDAKAPAANGPAEDKGEEAAAAAERVDAQAQAKDAPHTPTFMAGNVATLNAQAATALANLEGPSVPETFLTLKVSLGQRLDLLLALRPALRAMPPSQPTTPTLAPTPAPAGVRFGGAGAPTDPDAPPPPPPVVPLARHLSMHPPTPPSSKTPPPPSSLSSSVRTTPLGGSGDGAAGGGDGTSPGVGLGLGGSSAVGLGDEKWSRVLGVLHAQYQWRKQHGEEGLPRPPSRDPFSLNLAPSPILTPLTTPPPLTKLRATAHALRPRR